MDQPQPRPENNREIPELSAALRNYALRYLKQRIFPKAKNRSKYIKKHLAKLPDVPTKGDMALTNPLRKFLSLAFSWKLE